MEIVNTNLINFRNFQKLSISFSERGALIFGKNAAGKTNLLEAISYIAFGKSFRNANDKDIKRFKTDFFRISGNFILDREQYQYEVSYKKNHKNIKLNNNLIDKISSLYEYLKVVYLAPIDIEIISGSPTHRRRFLDISISQFSFEYIEILRKFKKILNQRNALLKTNFQSYQKRSWDKQFSKTGAFLMNKRKDYLVRFIPILREKYKSITDNTEDLTIKYNPSFKVENDDIESSFEKAIHRVEQKEKEFEYSLIGPQRDDIDFYIDNKPTRQFASQGQKRSLAIAARLSQADMIKEEMKTYPIMIFDDVLSDLDKYRAYNIINLLKKNHQIFIATPNVNLYNKIDLPKIDMEKIDEAE